MSGIKKIQLLLLLGIMLAAITACDLLKSEKDRKANVAVKEAPLPVNTETNATASQETAAVEVSGVVAVGVPLDSARILLYDVQGNAITIPETLTDIMGKYTLKVSSTVAFPVKLAASKGSTELLTILPNRENSIRHLNPVTTLVTQQTIATGLQDVTEESFTSQGNTVVTKILGDGFAFENFQKVDYIARSVNSQTAVSMADIVLDTLGELAQKNSKSLVQLLTEKGTQVSANTAKPFFQEPEFQLNLTVNLVITSADESSTQNALGSLSGNIGAVVQSYSDVLKSVKQDAVSGGLGERRQVKSVLEGITSAVQSSSTPSTMTGAQALTKMAEVLKTPLIQTVQTNKNKSETELVTLTHTAGQKAGAVIYQAIATKTATESLASAMTALVNQIATAVNQGTPAAVDQLVVNTLNDLKIDTASVFLQITFPGASAPPATKLRTLLRTTTRVSGINEVTKVTVTVRRKDNAALVATQDFAKNAAGQWAGTLNNLPRNIVLKFTANAYDSQLNISFTGSVESTLTGIDNTLAINLTQVVGNSLIFAKVTVAAPREMLKESAQTIRFVIEGQNNEVLNYVLRPALNGGAFVNNLAGTVTLTGTTGELLTTYQAPTMMGTYTHLIKFTNSFGNSTEREFQIQIVNAFTTNLNLQFSPIFNRMETVRRGYQVHWKALVEDDAPLDQLSYLWTFDGGLSFQDPRTNPAIMSGYTTEASGTLQLTITDASKASTTVTYLLKKGQFTESANTIPIARAGNAQTVAVNTLVRLNGGQSADLDGGTLTYSWKFVSKPENSFVMLEEPFSKTPAFTPDREGSYKLSLMVSDSIDTAADTVVILALADFSKPVLKLTAEADQYYTVSLWSPDTYRSVGLLGVENLGVTCSGFNNLQGKSDYQPVFYKAQDRYAISFTDVTGGLDIAGEYRLLYKFLCTATPQLKIGNTTAISYANAQGLVGPNHITTIPIN